MTDDYQPPEGTGLILEDIQELKTPDLTKDFEFDPDRSATELALLNAEPEPEPQSGPIKYWSFSTLSVFKECPLRVKFRKIDGLHEPSGPAAERGNEIHDHAERYVRGEEDTLPDAKKELWFARRFLMLKTQFQKGNVELEQDWCFDAEWNPITVKGKFSDDPRLWYIAKLDVFLREDQSSAVVIDYKTGRKFGNEMKHGQQALQYAVAAFMRYPELEHIRTEFWYLDLGEELIKTYTRDEAMVMLPRITNSALKLTTCTDFPPRPSRRNCKWCHFAESGDCSFAFETL